MGIVKRKIHSALIILRVAENETDYATINELVKRARKILDDVHQTEGYVPNDRDINVYAKTPKVCSCYMCGNPRKYYGEDTIQEKRMKMKK